MRPYIELTNALLECTGHCEDIGYWQNFGTPIACPIEQHVFQDCTDYCTLAMRLLIRCTITHEFLRVTQKGIEDCRDECLYVFEHGELQSYKDVYLAEAITDFEIAIKEINQFIQRENQVDCV